MSVTSVSTAIAEEIGPDTSDLKRSSICRRLLGADLNTLSEIQNPSAKTRAPKDTEDAPSRQLVSCGPGCLAYAEDGKPFDTVEGYPNMPPERATLHHGTLFVSADGKIFGTPFQKAHEYDEPPLDPQQPLLFLGQVTTDHDGRILSLNYRDIRRDAPKSTSDSQRPYRLKLLIDDLGGPKALKNVVVDLSDASSSYPNGNYANYQPKVTVADVYPHFLGDADTGTDVFLRYFLSNRPNPLRLDAGDTLTPAAVQIILMVQRQASIQKTLDAGQINEDQLLEKLATWLNVAATHHPRGMKIIATVIQNTEKHCPFQGNPQLKRRFFQKVFRDLPGLDESLRQNGMLVAY